MRYWKRVNPDGTINTVESYSHSLEVEGAIKIPKKDFDTYIAGLPSMTKYIIYTKKITTPKRTIYVSSMTLEDLTPEEITQFEDEGYIVEVIDNER